MRIQFFNHSIIIIQIKFKFQQDNRLVKKNQNFSNSKIYIIQVPTSDLDLELKQEGIIDKFRVYRARAEVQEEEKDTESIQSLEEEFVITQKEKNNFLKKRKYQQDNFPRRNNEEVSKEMRIKIVCEGLRTFNIHRVAQQYMIHPTTLRNWRRFYQNENKVVQRLSHKYDQKRYTRQKQGFTPQQKIEIVKRVVNDDFPKQSRRTMTKKYNISTAEIDTWIYQLVNNKIVDLPDKNESFFDQIQEAYQRLLIKNQKDLQEAEEGQGQILRQNFNSAKEEIQFSDQEMESSKINAITSKENQIQTDIIEQESQDSPQVEVVQMLNQNSSPDMRFKSNREAQNVKNESANSIKEETKSKVNPIQNSNKKQRRRGGWQLSLRRKRSSNSLNQALQVQKDEAFDAEKQVDQYLESDDKEKHESDGIQVLIQNKQPLSDEQADVEDKLEEDQEEEEEDEEEEQEQEEQEEVEEVEEGQVQKIENEGKFERDSEFIFDQMNEQLWRETQKQNIGNNNSKQPNFMSEEIVVPGIQRPVQLSQQDERRLQEITQKFNFVNVESIQDMLTESAARLQDANIQIKSSMNDKCLDKLCNLLSLPVKSSFVIESLGIRARKTDIIDQLAVIGILGNEIQLLINCSNIDNKDSQTQIGQQQDSHIYFELFSIKSFGKIQKAQYLPLSQSETASIICTSGNQMEIWFLSQKQLQYRFKVDLNHNIEDFYCQVKHSEMSIQNVEQNQTVIRILVEKENFQSNQELSIENLIYQNGLFATTQQNPQQRIVFPVPEKYLSAPIIHYGILEGSLQNIKTLQFYAIVQSQLSETVQLSSDVQFITYYTDKIQQYLLFTLDDSQIYRLNLQTYQYSQFKHLNADNGQISSLKINIFRNHSILTIAQTNQVTFYILSSLKQIGEFNPKTKIQQNSFEILSLKEKSPGSATLTIKFAYSDSFNDLRDWQVDLPLQF